LTLADLAWAMGILAVAVPLYVNPPLAVTLDLGLGWVVFAVLLVEREFWCAHSRRQRCALLAVVVLAFAGNCALSSGGPGDLHLNLAATWSTDVELRWGPAPISLFRLWRFALGGVSERGILLCNRVLSSLQPLLLYGICAELGIGAVAALLAA